VKGFGSALPYYVLIAITVATGYYQQRQMSARLPKDSVNNQMQMIGKIFPVVFGFISFSLPAGVVLYFIVSNLWQVGQQAITFRKFPPPAGDGAAPIPTTSRDPKGSSATSGKAIPSRDGRANGNGRSTGKPASGRAGKTGNGKSQNPTGAPSARSSAKSNPKSPAAKGKRPPPSPRPKGLPSRGVVPGQEGAPAKNSRRKDT